MGKKQAQPFESFGQALKKLREDTNKTPFEVSGAVEIDLARLTSFELGEDRPTEDILLLLIQHFDMPDTQAAELWRLAGYGGMPSDESSYFMHGDGDFAGGTQSVAVAPDDAKVVYTDMIQVMVNNYGVIMNFMQGAGPSNGPLAVARVGMSKEHAKSVVEILKTTLEQAEHMDEKRPQQTKQLPPGKKL